MMNRLLLALDGSDRDEAAFFEARRLAGPGGEIHLVHVVPPRPVSVGTPLLGMTDALPDGPVATGATGADAQLSESFPSSYPDSSPDEIPQLQNRAVRYLAELRNKVGANGGQDIVWTGSPAESILDVALQFNVDMIVMSRHGRSRFSRWLLGSVTDEVLRRSQLPILLVRGDAPARTLRLRRILVPLDGTAESRAILSAVKPLAVRLKLEILLLEIVAPTQPREGARDACHDLTTAGAAWQFARVQGDPAEEILRHALSRDADLIALSVSSPGGSGRLGRSVAEALLAHTELPVLLQHPVIHAPEIPRSLIEERR